MVSCTKWGYASNFIGVINFTGIIKRNPFKKYIRYFLKFRKKLCCLCMYKRDYHMLAMQKLNNSARKKKYQKSI